MIPLIKPDVSFAAVADDIRAVLDSGRLTAGRYVESFEAMVGAYVGTPYAFATTSATTALHISLVAAGIGSGDEVLVSDFTFPASGNAIVAAGAKPVLVDCHPGRFDMDVADAERKVTPATRAIMVVDPFGQPADLSAVETLAKRCDLFVVEDAACALGAKWDGKSCGSWQGVGCFSFHPRKLITTGEGGMITTADEELARKIQVLRTHGGLPAKVGLDFVANGFNYRLSEIQAVLGLEQMRRIDLILADRRATALSYIQALSRIDEVAIPLSTRPDDITFQSLVVMLHDDIDRDKVISLMRERGIETTLGTYAMHAHPAFSRFSHGKQSLPNSWRAQQQSLTLPLLPQMKRELMETVVTELSDILVRARKHRA